jgi:hypothetical protein
LRTGYFFSMFQKTTLDATSTPLMVLRNARPQVVPEVPEMPEVPKVPEVPEVPEVNVGRIGKGALGHCLGNRLLLCRIGPSGEGVAQPLEFRIAGPSAGRLGATCIEEIVRDRIQDIDATPRRQKRAPATRRRRILLGAAGDQGLPSPADRP